MAPTIPRPAVSLTSSSLHPSATITSFSALRSQSRHASFLKRPRRPYQFTQLIRLSDGSTYTVRTTSPQPVYNSQKDKMNHLLWQPSSAALRNIEVDEAGKLAAFRERFGRVWDVKGSKKLSAVEGMAAMAGSTSSPPGPATSPSSPIAAAEGAATGSDGAAAAAAEEEGEVKPQSEEEKRRAARRAAASKWALGGDDDNLEGLMRGYARRSKEDFSPATGRQNAPKSSAEKKKK